VVGWIGLVILGVAFVGAGGFLIVRRVGIAARPVHRNKKFQGGDRDAAPEHSSPVVIGVIGAVWIVVGLAFALYGAAQLMAA